MGEYDAALARLWELAVLLGEDMERGLARRGLTRSRAHLLWELRQRGPVTQRALSQALQVSSRNITGLVDALEATGFVTREPHPTDRRATLVTLTEAGAAATAAMDADQQDFARMLFADMPADDLAAFVATLDTLLTRLRAIVQQPATPEADTPRSQ